MKYLYSPLVGAHFRPPAKQVLNCLSAGAELHLFPEPENPYDEFAVKVLCRPSEVVPEEQMANLAQTMEGTGIELEELMAEPDGMHLGYLAAEKNKKLGNYSPNTAVLEYILGEKVIGAKLAFAPDGSPLVRVEVEND